MLGFPLGCVGRGVPGWEKSWDRSGPPWDAAQSRVQIPALLLDLQEQAGLGVLTAEEPGTAFSQGYPGARPRCPWPPAGLRQPFPWSLFFLFSGAFFRDSRLASPHPSPRPRGLPAWLGRWGSVAAPSLGLGCAPCLSLCWPLPWLPLPWGLIDGSRWLLIGVGVQVWLPEAAIDGQNWC